MQRLHALVMGGGKTRVRSTPYRDGQNVIRDAHSKGIVYMPPEAKDVPWLMEQLLTWINQKDGLPVPIKAGIAHYQYATIHPYCDGKGLCALEKYYARNLKAYNETLTVGPSPNYYMGPAEADITKWIVYFIEGTATSFEKVRDQALREAEKGGKDQSRLMRELDSKQRRALTLFRSQGRLQPRMLPAYASIVDEID